MRNKNIVIYMLSKLVFLLCFILLPATALTAPITIFGVNWGMEPMDSALEQKGYSCKEETSIWGASYTVCSNGNKEVSVESKKLTFNCHVFNGCDYELKEIAQNIVNQGVINNLNYEVENISDGVNNFRIEKYCERGKQGDILCVVQDISFLGQPIMQIQLMKGTFGKGGMSFD